MRLLAALLGNDQVLAISTGHVTSASELSDPHPNSPIKWSGLAIR